MNQDEVMKLATDALMLAFKIGLPLLLASLVVGLLVSVFQAVTQIQEQTLAFVPKLVAVSMVFLIGLPWMIQIAVKYTTDLYHSIPGLVKEETR